MEQGCDNESYGRVPMDCTHEPADEVGFESRDGCVRVIEAELEPHRQVDPCHNDDDEQKDGDGSCVIHRIQASRADDSRDGALEDVGPLLRGPQCVLNPSIGTRRLDSARTVHVRSIRGGHFPRRPLACVMG